MAWAQGPRSRSTYRTPRGFANRPVVAIDRRFQGFCLDQHLKPIPDLEPIHARRLRDNEVGCKLLGLMLRQYDRRCMDPDNLRAASVLC